ncbi:hypothetical protein F5Y00DRAFT_265662 [Daldinia vernicosa]|uniref:uncharacterized protein n=1 Tax=Daldinia vernicosa TaxID=114800 RepID=UPI0020080976|nr:uncharacterized protein F5Y00DRAFT_265662 [Daldinia vernicosa]KAI0845407.1 hypothetical protein F5Y00DRAFT_265662 [Daldinia vernicosa]
MADNKSQDKTVLASEEETKKVGPVSESTAQTDSGDNKTENAATSDSSSTSQSRPTRHLPTHYKGMPKQWEKNQVPKKDTPDSPNISS